MSLVVMRVNDGHTGLTAKDEFGGTIWNDEEILYRTNFQSQVRAAMHGHTLSSEDPRVDGLMGYMQKIHDDQVKMHELMAKMARRLDEIEGGDEWDKLNRLCWEPPAMKKEEAPF